MYKYGIFVAKIYKYALIDIFEGSAGSLDSAANCAALGVTGCKLLAMKVIGDQVIWHIFSGMLRIKHHQRYLLQLWYVGKPFLNWKYVSCKNICISDVWHRQRRKTKDEYVTNPLFLTLTVGSHCTPCGKTF